MELSPWVAIPTVFLAQELCFSTIAGLLFGLVLELVVHKWALDCFINK